MIKLKFSYTFVVEIKEQNMKQLTQREEQIMQILWKLRTAFVKEIIMEMDDPKPPYNTVSSIIRKLESEGIVAHEAFGKTHRYYPVLQKEDYKKSTIQRLVDDYFGGSPEQILSYFVKEEKLDAEEINNLLEQLKN